MVDLTKAVSLTQEPADYLRTPGRRADLYIGPFEFYVSTGDEGWLCFRIITPCCTIGWEWQGRARQVPQPGPRLVE